MKRIYLRLKRFNNGVHTVNSVRSNECREKERKFRERDEERKEISGKK